MLSKPKTTRLDMRVSPEEKDLFQKAADQDGRTLSNWIRDRLLKAANAEVVPSAKGRRRSAG